MKNKIETFYKFKSVINDTIASQQEASFLSLNEKWNGAGDGAVLYILSLFFYVNVQRLLFPTLTFNIFLSFCFCYKYGCYTNFTFSLFLWFGLTNDSFIVCLEFLRLTLKFFWFGRHFLFSVQVWKHLSMCLFFLMTLSQLYILF